MTLIEILVALSIFVIVGGAMLGIMLKATEIYEATEASKAASDEAMAVLGMLDRDLARAVAPGDGGHFIAGVVNQKTGACAVGWTIRNQDANHPARTKFVYWVLDDGKNLRRGIFDGPDDVYSVPAAGASTITCPVLDNKTEQVTGGCLHFGVWLVGTSHNLATDGVKQSFAPEPERHWTRVLVANTNAYTEPIPEVAYDTRTRHSDAESTPLAYPATVRFTVLLTGNNRRATVARLRKPLGRTPADYTETDPGEAVIPIVGVSGLASLPGSLLLLEDEDPEHPQSEIIGYHGYRDGMILINTAAEHGPLNAYGSGGEANGRAVFRCEIPTAGTPFQVATTRVRLGTLYTLVKTLNR